MGRPIPLGHFWPLNKPFTFPFSGIARFIILAIFAIGKNRSCSRSGVFFDGPSLQESSD